VTDVVMVILGFEMQNNCRLEIRMNRIDVAHTSDLMLAVIAHPHGDEIGEVPPLASVNVKCSDMNLRHLESAVIAALYKMDFQLAEKEFAATFAPKA
jgi:hypothetical protein